MESFEIAQFGAQTNDTAAGPLNAAGAALLRVEVSTLRNCEQGTRDPTGPAKALLYAIRKDPTKVLKALAA